MPTILSTKLLQLLKTFSEEELKSFDAWLRSPWFNSNKTLIRLLAQLKKYHPAFTSSKLTKEKLFSKILPNGKFSDRRMNNLMSECYLAAEQFLAFYRFSNDQSLQKKLLLKELQGRYLDDWFFKAADQEIDQLEQKEVQDWEDHLSLFQLHRQIYHHPNQKPRLERGETTIIKMGEQLDLLYLLEKATIINEKVFRSQVLSNESNKYEIEKEITKWLSDSEELDHPALLLYQLRFTYTPANRLKQYGKLQQLLFDQFDHLNEKEQKIHLWSLLNDAVVLIKQGRLEITDALPIYQLGLKTKALFHQGKLTLNTYTAIVMASNTKKDFAYTEHFIKEYTPYLDEKIQADSEGWAKAHTAYWKRNLTTCLDLLLQYHFKITYFQYISRVLHTQVYFELYLQDDSYQQYLYNYFDTYEKWLHREKVWSEASKASFISFVQRCRALARCYDDVNFDTKKVKRLLNNVKNIQALNWLKEKQKEVLHLRQ